MADARCPLPGTVGLSFIKCSMFMATLYLHKELGFFMEVFNSSIYIETVVLVSLYLALIYVNFGVVQNVEGEEEREKRARERVSCLGMQAR